MSGLVKVEYLGLLNCGIFSVAHGGYLQALHTLLYFGGLVQLEILFYLTLSPCFQNSSISLSTHCTYRVSGLVGLDKSEQWIIFWRTCNQKDKLLGELETCFMFAFLKTEFLIKILKRRKQFHLYPIIVVVKK